MSSLPVLPATSTAAKTKFVAEQIVGHDGRYLYVDGNQKITAGCGTYEDPRPNAFSLLQIADCPYRTSLCETACYVHNLEKAAPDTHALYAHNSRTIREILGDDSTPDLAWADSMASWIEQNCPDFRWHVSGDVYSYQYAEWIARVCRWSPNTRHWIYTRSVAYLEPLSNVDNLVVNLSADAENYNIMRRAARDYGFRICYLTTDGTVPIDLPHDSVVFPDYALRAGRDGKLDESMPGYEWFTSLGARTKRMVCPVDVFGKSESVRCGVCVKCMV
jgi:hypothetical protein